MIQIIGIVCCVVLAIVCIAGATAAYQIFFFTLRRKCSCRQNLEPLTGYVVERSLCVGDVLKLCVHSEHNGEVIVHRINGDGDEEVARVPVSRHEQNRRYDYWNGCGWDVNVQIPTDEFSAGFYVIELRSDAAESYYMAALIRSQVAGPIAVVASTNTWDCYNDFAGLSNYTSRGLPWILQAIREVFIVCNWRQNIGDRHWIPTTPLSTQRPNDAVHRELANLDENTDSAKFCHLAFGELSLIRFLEREGLEYSMYSDYDFAFAQEIDASQCVIFNTHSEYWTSEMMSRLKSLEAQGGKIIFLSGNNIYRQVEFLSSGIQVINQKLDANLAAELTGLGYDARGYMTFAPFRLLKSDHWITENVASIGQSSHFCSPDSALSPTTPQRGGSGWETDKRCLKSGPVTVLATGLNAEGAAEIVCREHASGGWVFNTGSVSSSAWIGHDTTLDGMLRNLLNNALQRSFTNHDFDTVAHQTPLPDPLKQVS